MSDQLPPIEYPRPQGPAYGRGPGVYFSAIGEAWDLVRKDLGHWIAATLVLFITVYALQRPIGMLMDGLVPNQPRFDQLDRFFGVLLLGMALNVLPNSIATVMVVGMILMGVRKARGEYINVGMMFEPFGRFGTLFATNLLYLLLVTAATLLILPAFFIVPVLVLMPAVAYMKKAGPFEALSLTFDTCKGHWGGLFALLLALAFVLLGGLCACIVGILVAWPIYCVVLAIHYRAFFEPAQ